MTRRVSTLIVLLVCLVLFFCCSKSSHASDTSHIIINEISWAGSSSSSADEWIELKNTTSSDIDISGWTIANAATSGGALTIPANSSIPAGGYYLIANYGIGDKTILDTNPDFVTTSISLKNEDNGDLILKDTLANVIDKAKGDAWPAGSNDSKSSMERISSTDGLDPSSWQTASTKTNIVSDCLDLGTPKAPNSPPVFSAPENFDSNISDLINLSNAYEAFAQVTNIVDGDTVDIDLAGNTKRVRLIGVDTPKSASDSIYHVDESYYNEAKQFASDALLGKNIKILVSATITNRYDNYDRLLAIIIVDDYVFNTNLLEKGLAKTYYLDNELIQSTQWQEIEQNAIDANLGVWKPFDNPCIRINEFIPNPTGEDSGNEWVEFYNQCDYEVSLDNWFLDDIDGGSNPYKISENSMISAKNYKVFYSSETNITLNNSNDRVRLLSPFSQMADEVIYDKDAPEGKSYALIDGTWSYVENPTPGSANIIQTNDSDYQNVDKISDIKNIPKDSLIKVTGIANSTPGLFSKQYFYIQDGTGGAQIYNYGGNFEDFSIGNILTIYGQISDTKFLRIKTENPTDISISSDTNDIKPVVLPLDDIDASYQGRLVTTSGIVTQLSGNIFYLKDSDKLLKVDIRDGTAFKRPGMSSGNVVSVTGVIYLSSTGTISLLPRFQSDIVVSSAVGGTNLLSQIKDIKSYSDGDYISIKGIINSLPGMIDKRYFYIEDESGAVQIYHYDSQFPPGLSIGDEVMVFGVLSNDRTRVKITDLENINIISHQNIVNITQISPQHLDQDIGKLVHLSGKIIKKGANKFYLGNYPNIVIYLRKNNGIISSNYRVSDYVEIYGILELYKGEYRINPRFISDINCTHIAVSNSTSNKPVTKDNAFIQKASASTGLVKGSKIIDKPIYFKYNHLVSEIFIAIFVLVCQIILLYILWKKPITYKTNPS